MEQEILARLDALAERLGVAAGYLWEITVTQASLHGAIGGMWFMISIIILVLSLGMIYKIIQKEQGRNTWDDSSITWTAIAAVVGIVSIIVASVNLNIAISRLFNPEFYALRYIIEAL